ncbi:conserved hypothetical protein [Leishmania major strain Friedlin]|uniref:Uncharacterized protein n=1 Tax=Leishmania major TaxID=5664 RepID=Q4Q1D8_LEIMA|nr:conserved hypothetical protein [Leishmania major strain Friedlin]CAG9583816.1 hypothetical_protein_-_conserved [Leishmania major strain Friedlin]CAJ09243.1 conserved hypothetical protein [Leishmania major strain Friedlin]|eukprot:XP_001686860.1 conserved hypothetical protein [Leishmania major strain Friedlin]
MFFIYPTPQYPRRALEFVFKSLYMFANTMHLISLVVLISDFYTRLSNSMPSYYTNRDLVISDAILLVMENCIYTGSIRLGNVHGTVEVTAGNIGYGLMTTAQYVTGLFVLEFLLLVNNFLVAFNYTKGNRHLRIFGVHVPLYHITVMMTQVYSIAIVVLVWAFDGNRQLFQRALQHCAEEMRKTRYEQLLKSEFDGYTIFSTAVYWPFAATCVAELIYVSAVVFLCYFSNDEGIILFSEADAPWESRGLLCNTSKPLLKLHTAQRNAIIEDARNAIKEGQKVRIVRSYQLITEEAFEALVQAMREQVARALKEKQFEQLKRTFGDNESQLDNMGFAWRENLMASHLDEVSGGVGNGLGNSFKAGPADQFFNVPFEDYFTDNGGAAGRPEVPCSVDPLSIQEGGLGDDDGAYGDGNNGFMLDPADGGSETVDAWSPREGANMVNTVGEIYDPPQPQQHTQHASHTKHRSRRRRRRGDHAEEDDEDYQVEPDPRDPSQQQRGDGKSDIDGGNAYTSRSNYFDANDDMVYVANDMGGSGGGYVSGAGPGGRLDGTTGNYPLSTRESRQRQQSRGRQAGLEQEDDVADELSDELG